MMVELSLVSGRPLRELLELEPEELATVVDVVEELGGRRR